MHARTILGGVVILALLIAGWLMLKAGSAVVASTAQTPTAMPTSTDPPPPVSPTATPVDSAYAPAVFEMARTATATISPDASPTIWLTATNPPLPDTPTAVPPYPSATPVDSAYAPVVFEMARTATATFTPTATISPDATPTIWLTATAPTP
jgi:hypothetical protein